MWQVEIKSGLRRLLTGALTTLRLIGTEPSCCCWRVPALLRIRAYPGLFFTCCRPFMFRTVARKFSLTKRSPASCRIAYIPYAVVVQSREVVQSPLQ